MTVVNRLLSNQDDWLVFANPADDLDVCAVVEPDLDGSLRGFAIDDRKTDVPAFSVSKAGTGTINALCLRSSSN